jgi:N-acetylneuraminic acid mutarotase
MSMIGCFLRGVASWTVVIALAACGGGHGGGGGGPPPTASTPSITKQPAATSAPIGGTASLTIAATANGVLTYQWYPVFEGAAPPDLDPIPGATSATLTVSGIAVNAGGYYCVVTNTLNGTTLTATSANAYVTLVPATANATISTGSAALPNTAGLVASVSSQTGVTYAWTISNGTITAGQGTSQITYTSGALGQLQITANVSSPTAGTSAGVANLFVVPNLPVVSIFAQSSVLPGANGVSASTTSNPGQTYAWTLQSGTASAVVVGSSTDDVLTYNLGTTVGSYQISVDVTDAASKVGSASQTVSVVTGTFLKDPRDMAARSLHTGTLLTDGRVLLVGGDAGIPDWNETTGLPIVSSESNIVATAELFDPVTETSAFVGSLATARAQHTATLLNDGRVLVAGGLDATGTPLASTEIYSPASGAWTAGPPMSTARELPSATLLADGRVLIAGGSNASGVLASAEIFDPIANSWSSAGTMIDPRVLHSATLLGDGRVMAAGGLSGSGTTTASSSAELYNPTSNNWQATPPIPHGAVYAQGAVLLPSGKVLQLGQAAEIYDPVANTWADSEAASDTGLDVTGPGGVGDATTAILLPNGTVLAAGGYSGFTWAIYDPVAQLWTSPTVTGTPAWGIAGGYSSVTALQDGRVLVDGGVVNNFPLANGQSVPGIALYDPTQGSWSFNSSEAHSGYYAASGVLGNGQVLVAGGADLQGTGGGAISAVAAADLFDPSTNLWSASAPMSTARQQHTATVLQSGEMLVTGGTSGVFSWLESNSVFSSAELYNSATNSWNSVGSMSTARYQHTASLLGNGEVLVAGGNDINGTCSCTTFVSSADLYNPATNIFTATGTLNVARYAHTATVLQDGTVLVVGGFGGPTSTLQSGGGVLASAEIYNPAAGTWTVTSSMTTARMSHTASLLPSGEVLVSGGTTGSATTATAEVFNPGTGTWTPVASMSTPRQSHGAVTLANGTVLVVGGLNDSTSAVIGVGTAEVYDPITNSWSPSGAMVTTRQFFVLNALGDGRILLEGGAPNVPGLPEFYR